MNEAAEGHDGRAIPKSSPPASSSPLSSPSRGSTQTWPPLMVDGQMEQDRDPRGLGAQSSPPSRFYEELFCTSRTSITLAPLAGALVTTSSRPQSDVVKQGYLGKLERNHRSYFVLRAGSHTGPSRLEWHKSRENFAAVEKSAGKAALFGSSKQGVIYLRCCLGVSRIGSSRRGHAVALYAKDQTTVLVAEDRREQEEWYLAVRRLMEEERKDEEYGDGFEEEDDGYCTLPPAAFFKEVWPVTVKPRGLGSSKSLAGDSRLCLTATSLILVRVGACSGLPSVTLHLLSVRRFGHLDGSFFLELGRSAPSGPGEIWMEARDQGNPAAAQHIHEVVRDTVRALRALPDFSRSPTSSHSQLQTLLASKRCRPKFRPLPSRPALAPPPRSPEIPADPNPARRHAEPLEPDETDPESTLSSASHLSPFRSQQSPESEAGSYMEMKMDHHHHHHHLPLNKRRGDGGVVSGGGMEGWEPGEEGEEEEEEEEEEEKGPGYMMMSPQISPSLSALPQDDYMTMASPHKHSWPSYSSPSSSLQTSFNSSASDSYSPMHPSCHQTNEHGRPQWLLTSAQHLETEAGQSQTSTGRSTRPQDEPEWASGRRLPALVRSVGGSGAMTPFVTSGPGCTRPVQASPNSGTGQSSRLQAAADPSHRYWLSWCLPSCLQADDRP